MTRPLVLVLMLIAAACSRDRDGDGDGGTGMDAARSDGAAGEACGTATCPAGSRCCDRCDGSCVPEESGAFCPADMIPHPPCADSGTAWTSCTEAHGRAATDDPCTFTGTCGNCCCEGSTSCIDGRIAIALCDCKCIRDDAGTP